MKTVLESENFDLTTSKRDWLWFRSFSKGFEVLFGLGEQILCIDVHSSFIEIRILFIGVKLWKNP